MPPSVSAATSPFFQSAFDRLFAWPTRTAFQWFTFRFFRRCYRTLAAHRNVLVKYSVDGCEIYFPALHETLFCWKFDPDNSKSIGRVAAACATAYPDSVILDVGANIGDSAAIIRSQGVGNTIVAIEGVAEFHHVLARNAELLKGVVPVLGFVGAVSHTAKAKLVVLAGGNAVVNERIDDAAAHQNDIEFITLDQVVERHAPGAQVKMLKTDIEGYDLPVLNGSLDFIATHRPVIYLELHVSSGDEKLRGVSWRDLWSNLRRLGYTKALYWYCSSDFLCMLDLNRDEGVIQDIHDYFQDRAGRLYLDVCLLHGKDAALAEAIYAGEKSHARTQRSRTPFPGAGVRP